MGNANSGNPNPSPSTRFRKGQSGNPGGKTAELKQDEQKAALISADLRLRAVTAIKEQVDNGADILALLDANILRLLRECEDRAWGTPKYSADVQAVITGRSVSELTDEELAAIALGTAA